MPLASSLDQGRSHEILLPRVALSCEPMMKTYLSWLMLWPACVELLTAERLVGIPTVPFSATSEDTLALASLTSLVVDTKYAEARDDRGATLIPPTLYEFAETFASDLHSVLGLNFSLSMSSKAEPGCLFLTLGNAADYIDATGAETPEGYTLSVASQGIEITGASPLGVWWATRTVLQQAILTGGELAWGRSLDVPGWGTRGMMLDAGRYYYPPSFIVEMCAYSSFFKQNTFHLHLSDNFNVNTKLYSREFSLKLFARFRLWSDSPVLAGLNKFKNESYTREQFDHIQSACAARGVAILPEIEAPGHALAIVQWKPELGLSDDLSLLNISHPETIPTMKTIWSEFLPWFHTKTVHIGADEYTAGAPEYNRFVNEMSAFITEESGKDVRIWGTFPPKPEYDNIHRNVSIQHWAFFEDNPLYDYIMNDYSVLNSDDGFYVVNKWSASYPQSLDIAKTFHGNPSNDTSWYPYVFDQKNASNNPDASNPLVLGSIAPIWNDYGQNASVVSETYYAWREGIPALGDKQWGGDLAESEFASVLAALHPKIPAQNLERTIVSASSTIFNYSLTLAPRLTPAENGLTVQDTSGNGYDAWTDCAVSGDQALLLDSSCALKTPLSSKGRDYTLSLRIKVDGLSGTGNATLIHGGDSALMLTPNITLFASGNYYRLNSTIPLQTWVDLSIIGQGNRTFASVSAVEEGGMKNPLAGHLGPRAEFLAVLGVLGQFHVWAPVAIEAPLTQVGGAASGWSGQLASMTLGSEA